jgi:ribulose-phosphate 3-epimerase
MDGKFVPNTTWNSPEELEELQVSVEAHLMILEPEKYAEKWIDAGVKRVIFHIEATHDPNTVIGLCRKLQVDVGIAINPETDLSVIQPIDELVDTVLVMGVTPGFGGQEFKPEVINKIKSLRKANPHLTIGVDGGMNEDTAKEAVEAGANIIVAGSYIFGSNNIEKAIKELKNACQS